MDPQDFNQALEEVIDAAAAAGLDPEEILAELESVVDGLREELGLND